MNGVGVAHSGHPHFQIPVLTHGSPVVVGLLAVAAPLPLAPDSRSDPVGDCRSNSGLALLSKSVSHFPRVIPDCLLLPIPGNCLDILPACIGVSLDVLEVSWTNYTRKVHQHFGSGSCGPFLVYFVLLTCCCFPDISSSCSVLVFASCLGFPFLRKKGGV